MLNIYLLRHGETAWNADGNRYCGRTDLPLTEKGIQQAEAVRQQLTNITLTAVYASPLKRALRTAEIASGGKRVVTDNRLIEIDFGVWEGKTKEEFIAENRNLWHNWINDPEITQAGGTGETAGTVVSRADSFFKHLLETHTSGNILVVGHNGLNRLFLSHKLGMPLKNYRKFFLDNATITMFTLDESGELIIKFLNSKL